MVSYVPKPLTSGAKDEDQLASRTSFTCPNRTLTAVQQANDDLAVQQLRERHDATMLLDQRLR